MAKNEWFHASETARRRQRVSIYDLPDELLTYVLWFLDVNDLLATAKTSHHFRELSLDPLLHRLRLKYAHDRVSYLLPRRPPLTTLQPPISFIYLTKTHLAARKLHWSLVCIRLQRSLSRRPGLAKLLQSNVLPKECCKYDRQSGEFVLGAGVAGALVERKRKVEREQIKEGLRVWLERKAREIGTKKKDGGVGVMVWRFSRKMKLNESSKADELLEEPRKERVTGLRRFWEGLAS